MTSDRNRGIGDRRFEYRRCDACGTTSLADVPADLADYYPDEYYVLPSLEEQRAIARGEAYRMGFVAPHASGGQLTEVGPGTGVFAVQAQDAGFDTVAIEMDERASRYLRDVIGIRVITSDEPERVLETLAPSRVVALWHVLEHLPRPRECLEAAAGNLEPGGVLVVAVPNPHSLGFRILRGRWPHVDAPRHLCLIPAPTLVERLGALGLEPVELSTDDAGARHWNRFAWQYALGTPADGRLRWLAARFAGAAVAAALAPLERRGRRGATYTAVFRKPDRR